mmetsp:Transcript_97844/g.281094  ORF Transcript_97844/g.281094 Transcript_97844/m.281094 type:complete len:81 (+) Transcript_97844:343-585(+)
MEGVSRARWRWTRGCCTKFEAHWVDGIDACSHEFVSMFGLRLQALDVWKFVFSCLQACLVQYSGWDWSLNSMRWNSHAPT